MLSGHAASDNPDFVPCLRPNQHLAGINWDNSTASSNSDTGVLSTRGISGIGSALLSIVYVRYRKQMDL
jgi:hypothetical protein